MGSDLHITHSPVDGQKIDGPFTARLPMPVTGSYVCGEKLTSADLLNPQQVIKVDVRTNEQKENV